MDKLTEIYGEREAHNLKKIIAEYNNRHPLSSSQLCHIYRRLEAKEPIQYVLEEAYFYDSAYYVNSHVLIPRPETEELVHLILKNHDTTPLSLLDIGTGSGYITIALKKNRPQWDVSALDISHEAIEVAKVNAQNLNTAITFYQQDILLSCPLGITQDIIVSNPPYIPEKEMELMHDNVLKYEPHTALFVPDDNPLQFYDAISSYALENPNHRTFLYLEINEYYAKDTVDLLEKKDFINIQLHQDLQGKMRIISAIAPNKQC